MSTATVRSLLTAEEIETIQRAVAEAESRTSGEIVPVVVGACDDYDEAAWKAAAIVALVSSLATGLLHLAAGLWGGVGVVWITLPCAGGAALGYVLARAWPALRRAMVPEETLTLRVERRARQAFLEEEVFATRERTGILLLVAVFERRVVVLGDAGINRAVQQSAWEGVVATLVQGIRTGRLGEALVRAIADCGRLLEEHGVEIRPDDQDELSDAVRLEER